jgi:hypothetical protein
MALTIARRSNPVFNTFEASQLAFEDLQLLFTTPRISVLATIGLLLLLPILAAAVPPAPPKLTAKTQFNSSECGKPCPSRT